VRIELVYKQKWNQWTFEKKKMKTAMLLSNRKRSKKLLYKRRKEYVITLPNYCSEVPHKGISFKAIANFVKDIVKKWTWKPTSEEALAEIEARILKGK
jgi:hypothetical protein